MEHAGDASSHNSTRPHRVANVVLMQPGRDPRQGRLEGTTGNGAITLNIVRAKRRHASCSNKPSLFQAMGRTHNSAVAVGRQEISKVLDLCTNYILASIILEVEYFALIISY